MSNINTPFYESFIERHFPGIYASRQENRLRGQALATYGGAVSTRLGRQFRRQISKIGGSARDRYANLSMMERGRHVYRNNPIGHALINVETDNIVADELVFQSRTGRPDFDREHEDRWYTWLEKADRRAMWSGSQLQRMSWQQPRLDGDGGFILVNENGESRLQYIPKDLIRNKDDAPNSPTLTDGIEHDKAGRPIRFHVYNEDEFGNRGWEVIDHRDFVYFPHLAEPLDMRGITCFAQSFTLLDQLDGYIDAVIVAARMAAIFGLIFKTANPQASRSNLPLTPNGNGDQQRAITLEEGMARYIGREDDVVQVQAGQPMQQTPDFIRAIFRLICGAFDMPLEIGMRDLSQVNFSGGRIGLIGYYRSCRTKQRWLTTRWDKIHRWWISREVRLRPFKSQVPPNYFDHEFLCREWEYNDPVKEAQGDLLEISMGIKAPQQAAAARGRDYDETQKLLATAIKKNEDLGIPNVLSSMTREVGVNANEDPNSKDTNE